MSYAILLELARLNRMVAELGNNQQVIERKIDAVMATSSENRSKLEAKLDMLAASLAGIRADITGLKSQITTGMTEADVDAVLAKLTSISDAAAVLDAETPAAAPPPPPPPAPTA